MSPFSCRALGALGLGAALALGFLVTDVAGRAPVASACMAGPGLTRTAQTRSYVFVLHVGAAEEMYDSAAAARAKHARGGEIMLSGEMVEASKANRHLEVRICSRRTGKVLAGAYPTIVVVDPTTGTKVQLPIAAMVGVGESKADLHYGNNVTLTAGRTFAVTVGVGPERAVFHLRLP